MFYDLLAILICIIILIIYLNTKKYYSVQGLLIAILCVLLIVFKSKEILINLNFNKILLPVIIFTIISILLLIYLGYKSNSLRIPKWFFPLLLIYLFFGIGQQILYQSIFHNSINNLLNNQILSVFLTSLFILAFHIDKKHYFSKQFKLMIFPAIFWSIMFAIQPNVILLGTSHGILASVYYIFIHGKNIIKEKF
ncbi:hypothetical protein AYK26_03325 [Euryarchaeota archaeon SM23-78]|nr:MAG: hypothetical protein AYK26_03325 [Euryarchaeota archaeon SM23-78]MBW3000811.1 hypothetical protein [Candidatus Woesearchaeota archaeon]